MYDAWSPPAGSARRGVRETCARGAWRARRCAWGLALLVWGLATIARAHNLDTSYARFTVTATAIESRFTYDVYSLVRIVPGLDANGDAQVSSAELQAQVGAIQAYLRKHVAFEIDGVTATFGAARPVAFPPDVGDAIAEKDYHAASALVHFAFVHDLPRPAQDFWVQFDLFGELGDRHTVLGAIAHDGQEHEVVFRRWEPDYLYDTGYQPPPPPPPATAAATPIEEPVMRHAGRSNLDTGWLDQVRSFFLLGVEHIFIGYDHILFLMSLLVVCRFGELIKIVTSFTVAHTITLILATLEVVQVSGRWVETAIAATIVYVAVENFWVRDTKHRWRLTFAFGLIHGFGFAGVLREMGLPTEGLVRSLLAFNVGVEAGQLAIVSLMFVPMAAIRRWKYGRRAQLALSAVIAAFGLAWLVERALGLSFMPI